MKSGIIAGRGGGCASVFCLCGGRSGIGDGKPGPGGELTEYEKGIIMNMTMRPVNGRLEARV